RGLAVLRGRLTWKPGKPEVGKTGSGPGTRTRPWARLEEDRTQSRGLFLGAAALFVGIDGRHRHGRGCNGLTSVLGIEDGAAEITGKRRSEHRAGVVARQAGQSVGGGAVVDGIEFFAAWPRIAGLQR